MHDRRLARVEVLDALGDVDRHADPLRHREHEPLVVEALAEAAARAELRARTRARDGGDDGAIRVPKDRCFF